VTCTSAARLSADRLLVEPWAGRTPAKVAGHRHPVENTTPRIPEPVLGMLLDGALFYVQVAAGDIFAASAEFAGYRPDAPGGPSR